MEKGIAIIGSGDAGRVHIPPDIQAKIDKGEIIVVSDEHPLNLTDLHHADVQRLVSMQVEETELRLELLANLDTGKKHKPRGKNNRRPRRNRKRQSKKFGKRYK